MWEQDHQPASCNSRPEIASPVMTSRWDWNSLKRQTWEKARRDLLEAPCTEEQIELRKKVLCSDWRDGAAQWPLIAEAEKLDDENLNLATFDLKRIHLAVVTCSLREVSQEFAIGKCFYSQCGDEKGRWKSTWRLL